MYKLLNKYKYIRIKRFILFKKNRVTEEKSEKSSFGLRKAAKLANSRKKYKKTLMDYFFLRPPKLRFCSFAKKVKRETG